MNNNCLTYILIGDSISVDQSAFNGYGILIRNYLRDIKGKSVTYINRAMSGWTALGMSNSISWCGNYSADIAIIAIGINDANDGIYTPAFNTYVQAIINKLKLRNPNINIILCCPTRPTDATRIANLPEYRTAITTLASDNDCYCCHFENAWAQADAATYTADGLHPTSAGHILMYNLLTPILDEIMED